jgi:hypothetical protein
MMGTIGPVVHREGKLKLGLLLYCFVLVATSAAVGFTLGTVGEHAPREVMLAMAVGACVALGFAFVLLGRLPTTSWPPQMPKSWINPNRPLFTVTRFAFVFGLVFATPIRSAVLLPFALVVAGTGEPMLAAALFAALGFVKTIPTLLTASDIALRGEVARSFDEVVRRRSLIARLNFVSVFALLGAVAVIVMN